MTPNGLKLLVEQPCYDIDLHVVEEGKDKQRTMYIGGPYLMAEQKNKNGRIYSIDEMSTEVNRYITEMVKSNRSLGELNHPTSVEINPERACHMVTELKQDGNMFVGRSKILGTPMGELVKTLLMDGVKLGISSRALGKLNPASDGHNDVTDFRLICCDVVHDPSVDNAFVDGILESKQYILKCDGSVCEFVEDTYNKFEGSLCTMPKHNKDEYIKENVLKFISNLKNLS